jgi:hypothetical protein
MAELDRLYLGSERRFFTLVSKLIDKLMVEGEEEATV